MEARGWCQISSSMSILLFQTVSLTELRAHEFGWTGWPANPRGLSVSILQPPALGLWKHAATPSFFIWVLGSKSGPYACTEPSPQPWVPAFCSFLFPQRLPFLDTEHIFFFPLLKRSDCLPVYFWPWHQWGCILEGRPIHPQQQWFSKWRVNAEIWKWFKKLLIGVSDVGNLSRVEKSLLLFIEF